MSHNLHTSDNTGTSPNLIEKLQKRLRLYRAAVILLTMTMVVVVPLFVWVCIENYAEDIGRLFHTNHDIPYYDEIEDILEPLQYSFVPILMRPDVRISLDFEQKVWRLHNVHKFDAEGKFILEQGRYGTCSQLAGHVYQEIIPLFKDGYIIEFVRAAESKFFQLIAGEHLVLRISEAGLLRQNVYILDPTFRKYGRLEEFDDYFFISGQDFLPFLENRSTDQTFLAGTSTPLLMKKKFMVWLMVDSVNTIFDEQHFDIGLYMSRPYRYIQRRIFCLRKNGGAVEIAENEKIAKVMKPEEYYRLRARVIEFFEEITGESLPENYKNVRTYKKIYG